MYCFIHFIFLSERGREHNDKKSLCCMHFHLQLYMQAFSLKVSLYKLLVWFTEQWARRIPVRSLRYTNLLCARFQNMLHRSGIYIWLKMCKLFSISHKDTYKLFCAVHRMSRVQIKTTIFKEKKLLFGKCKSIQATFT